MYDLRSPEVQRKQARYQKVSAAEIELSDFCVKKCGQAITFLNERKQKKIEHAEPSSYLRQELRVERREDWIAIIKELLSTGIVSLQKSRSELDRPDMLKLNFERAEEWPERPYLSAELKAQIFEEIKITQNE